MNWIKLTMDNANKETIYVNLETATDILRPTGSNTTHICFTCCNENNQAYVRVIETPEQILRNVPIN